MVRLLTACAVIALPSIALAHTGASATSADVAPAAPPAPAARPANPAKPTQHHGGRNGRYPSYVPIVVVDPAPYLATPQPDATHQTSATTPSGQQIFHSYSSDR